MEAVGHFAEEDLGLWSPDPGATRMRLSPEGGLEMRGLKDRLTRRNAAKPLLETPWGGSFSGIAVLDAGFVALAVNDHPSYMAIVDPDNGNELSRDDRPRLTVEALAALGPRRVAVAWANDRPGVLHSRCWLEVWDIDTSLDGDVRVQRRSSLEHPGGGHRARTQLAVLPDGRLASSTYWGKVHIWNVTAEGSLERDVSPRTGHDRPVDSIVALADNRIAVVADDLRVWSTGRATQFVVLTTEVGGTPVGLPDGRVASVVTGDRVAIWDPTNQYPPVLLPHSAGHLAVLSDGRLASATRDRVLIWDWAGTEAASSPVALDAPPRDWPGQLAATPDGRVAALYPSGDVWVWDTAAGPSPVTVYRNPRRNQDTEPRALTVLPDARLVTVCGYWLTIWGAVP
jgi:hypothetical protein